MHAPFISMLGQNFHLYFSFLFEDVSKHEQGAVLPHLIGAPACVNEGDGILMAPQQEPRQALLRAPTGPPCILSRYVS
jgi:hypothetical protein